MKKHNVNNVLMLDEQDMLDMLSELSFLRITIDEDIKQTVKSLKTVNLNMQRNINNFDDALAKKSAEVLEMIDIKEVQKMIVKQVTHELRDQMKGVDYLSNMSDEMVLVADELSANSRGLKQLLNRYTKHLSSTIMFSNLFSVSIVFGAFFLGTLFNPMLLYFIKLI